MKTAKEIKAQFDAWREEYRREGGSSLKSAWQGVIIGQFQRAAGGEQQRHAIQEFLWHKKSSKTVDTEIRYALQKWVDPKYDDSKGWSVRPELYEECQIILAHVSERKAWERDLLREVGFDE